MNSPLFSAYKTDKGLEQAGIWHETETTTRDGVEVPVRFLLARTGGANESFAKALERATEPYKRLIQSKKLGNKKAGELYRTAFIGTALLDWENVQNEEGEFIPFNRENAEWLLEALPDLYEELRETANDAAVYREVVLEADLGNSGTFSDTDSN